MAAGAGKTPNDVLCTFSLDYIQSTAHEGSLLLIAGQTVESAEMLYALYETVDKDPRVKFKF